MSDIFKTYWQTGDTQVHLTMPLTKIDKENRLVSGFATLDNLDTQGDIVTSEASKLAFSRFRGNIREMHQPIAAGRLVDFKEDKYYDAASDTWYNGVFVTAYISKGAESTWTKVLDRTLTGFSIGGSIKKSEPVFDKRAQKTTRIIKDFDLSELSLVDNPANQLANIFSITKVDSGFQLEGELADVEINNVFWCATEGHQIARVSQEEKLSCPACEKDMQRIGWVEGTDMAEVAEVVNKFIKDEPSEGGVMMSKEAEKTDEKPTSLVTDVDATENDAAEEKTEDVATDTVENEEVEPVDDVPTSDPDLEKALDDVRSTLNKTAEAAENVSTKVTAIESQLEEIAKSHTEAMEKTSTKIAELEKKLDSVNAETEKFLKRVDALEGATAIKKSLDTEDEKVEKSEGGIWQGSIFG